MKLTFHHIILIIAGLLLWSCSTDKLDNDKSVSEWQGKKIILPENMIDFLTGDTIDVHNSDFIIINYIDSSGCTGCKMKLALWSEFLDALDTLTETRIKAITIVNTTNVRDIKYLISRDNYNYPVYLDVKDTINSTNHFPSNQDLNTFLLDHNLKVIAIGNPIFDNGVTKFYKSIITGQNTISNNINAIVQVKNANINLGTLSPGEEVYESFTLINPSNDTIFIREIIPSCHCTNVTLSTDVILPKSGITGSLIYREDSFNGVIDSYISIYYFDFDYPSTIRLRGRINAKTIK
ncbi:MAG: DUF1573 domain-containing protein [Clostridium sp.]|nr:DUF1573 domain-containing protein [Clostridium sp.]